MKKRRRNLICEGGGGHCRSCISMHPFDLHVVTGVFRIVRVEVTEGLQHCRRTCSGQRDVELQRVRQEVFICSGEQIVPVKQSWFMLCNEMYINIFTWST